MLFRVVFAKNDYDSISALFWNAQELQVVARTSFIKPPLKQYIPCLPECPFNQELFLLFLRTLILF